MLSHRSKFLLLLPLQVCTRMCGKNVPTRTETWHLQNVVGQCYVIGTLLVNQCVFVAFCHMIKYRITVLFCYCLCCINYYFIGSDYMA